MTDIEIEHIPCPYCAGTAHDVFIVGTELDTYQYYRRLEGFDRLNYVVCRSCRLVFANPRLRYTDTTLDDLFPRHVADRQRKRPPSDPAQQRRASVKVRNVAQLLGERRGELLEIGCGSGNALAAAEEIGFVAIGTELYRGYVDYGRGRGLDVRPGTVNGIGFEDGTFDVVYMEDVLEHLTDPFSHLTEAGRVLKQGGLLFIHTWTVQVPSDAESAFGSDWRSNHNLDLTAHTTLFPQRLLEDFILGLGFKLRRADPLHWQGQLESQDPRHRVQAWDYYFQKSG